MEDFISTLSGTAYTGHLMSATDNQTPRIIETLMLDGSVSIQTVGSHSTRVAIEYYCDLTTRRALELCATSGTHIKVYFGAKIWTGPIGAPGVTGEPFIEGRLDKLTFTQLVMGVAYR